ncbi:MAG: hypothetical protein EOL88_12290 [Bacteroidia bacterium]|nr:DUF364 domain-containing protein [Bacteroidales bacterium]NCD42857.1 hypothetical protein [Bacteroidia bacterium]MDD2324221.1 DUF364 domain-containing protein [Bacteroidales bacterium]MDD3961192.1 DUF364 domain-containing protein [Bacteroidales bacterium]MDY0284616.1 DUF364 domain-containing protein [Bacteroidales bacterium]
MKEPLELFYDSIPYDPTTISRAEVGNCYIAIQLKNGRTGVCSTLLDPPVDVNPCTFQPDLRNPQHRMVYNAWLNAMINDDCRCCGSGDIFEVVAFNRDLPTVMVGFFKPLVAKIDTLTSSLRVFDHALCHPRLDTMEQLPDAMAEAKQIILTSTTIFNRTFLKILAMNLHHVPVFLLGPSTIMHDAMFCYPDIAGLFGTLFSLYDSRVLDTIQEGGGTRDFNIFARKVFHKNPDFKNE